MSIFDRRPFTQKDSKNISDLIIPSGLTPGTQRILPNIVLRVATLSGQEVEEFLLTTYGKLNEILQYPTLSGTVVDANIRDAGTF